ncbi:MAG: hypothetical protein KatS3mg105_0405 [Gemmatales bacterium]|nr:MAG: hypothetical protein KatS3mg105_0405 [Gemmatales bacterium]
MFRLFRIQVGFACLLCVLFAPVGCNKQSETDSVRHKTPIGEKTGQNTESSKTVAAKDSTKQTEEAEPVSNEHLVVTADWPQFRGANRDGRSTETGLLESWPKQGPPLVWTFAKAGVGYSGPAIVGDRLYIMGAREGTEFLIAINTKNGEEEWAVKIGPMFTWKGNNWNRGPSATPTIAGDHIYALGGQGILVCVDKDGKEVWRVDLPAKLGAVVNNIGGAPEKIGWGFAWSPLVDGDHLICQPGGKQGTLAALNKHTGEVVWRSQSYNDEASYASPVVAYIDGVKQYINLTNEGLTSVSPKDGSVLWRWERKPPYNDCVIGTPIVWGNYVYASVGFGNGCDLIQIKNKKVTPPL